MAIDFHRLSPVRFANDGDEAQPGWTAMRVIAACTKTGRLRWVSGGLPL